MRYAIFADSHSHTAALEAMLRHAAARQIDAYFCLGDVGLDDCVQRVRNVAAVTVFGNWEVSGWRQLSVAHREWALALPPVQREPAFWLTHAAPLWPAALSSLARLIADRFAAPMTQLFPYLHHESDALWQTLAVLNQAGVPLLFHGHTHRQLAWRFTAANQLQQLPPRPLTLQPGETWLIGVGSVGRPLDGPQPAYVIFDDQTQTIEWMRVSM